MNQYSDKNDKSDLRNQIMGLGATSQKKSYYPELMRRISELERFRDLIHETSDAIFVLNLKADRITDLNKSALSLLGITKDEVISKSALSLLGTDLRKIIDEIKYQKQGSWQYEVLISGKNKSTQIEASFLLIDNVNSPYIVIIARDITDRKRIEEENINYRIKLESKYSKRSEQLIVSNQNLVEQLKQRAKTEQRLEFEKNRLVLIMQTIEDAVIMVRHNCQIMYMNNAAEDFIAYKQNNSTENHIDDYISFSDDNLDISSLINRTLNNFIPERKDMINIMIKAKGLTRICFVSVTPINGDEKQTYAIIIIRDLTERLRYEDEIEKSQRLEALGILAGGIAHDFNNVLTSIIGNIGLCKDTIQTDNPGFMRLDEAEKAAFRAQYLTKQLLIFSKGGDPVKEYTSVENFIRDTAGYSINDARSTIRYSFAENLHKVNIDPGQFCQVIHNIVLNADQAMPNGGIIYISVINTKIDVKKNICQLPPGDYIKIIISDMGEGIPDAVKDQIFNPYFSTRGTGRGLGLTSAMFIIRKHQGSIIISSNYQKGTTVAIYLPAGTDPIGKEIKKTSSIPSGSKTALIMDDEEGILDIVSTLLMRNGWEVKTVIDGESAVTEYEKSMETGHPFDVLIMDLVIPGRMGGKEAMEKIIKLNPNAYAIVSSGYSQDPIMADPQKYGFSRVLPKPYKLSDLLKLLSGD